ncbi:hypothetical protein QFC20_007831 [Naganishia adeliensis]|uniref:Uncharacterized protein n=1 Tax=Naganishia adeliensis TaxID=92952 RepID=A0ACC2UUY2_9TREE|nr:hypothetical protein QFC20_007831 [Naganishia adeliensis]
MAVRAVAEAPSPIVQDPSIPGIPKSAAGVYRDVTKIPGNPWTFVLAICEEARPYRSTGDRVQREIDKLLAFFAEEYGLTYYLSRDGVSAWGGENPGN